MYVLNSVLYVQQQICTCSVTKQRGEIIKNTFGEHTALQSTLQTGVHQSLHLGFSNDLSHKTFPTHVLNTSLPVLLYVR